MNIEVTVQHALDDDGLENLPGDEQIVLWVRSAVQQVDKNIDIAHVTVRVVSREEIAELNTYYRGKQGPTNVLSFPFEAPPGLPAEENENELGDIVVCAAVVAQEALGQEKSLESHWAHMIVHGCLHLLGYDHLHDDEALQMESLEKTVLGNLGYADPYLESA
jgi:probable rRNA maturation factor